MSGAAPNEIWEEGLEEGERRLERRLPGLAATGFAGGADVLFGLVAVIVTTGALTAAMPEPTAHVLGALTFGFGLAFITIGRAELFTENFLIPVGAVFAGRAKVITLLRMWVITLAFNLIGLALFAGLFAVDGVLKPDALKAVGTLADTLGDRACLPSFLSAIAAGTMMTLFTWVAAASDSSIARIVASLIAGFLLIAPALNHAVVGFGEMIFGIFAGTAHSGWGDLFRNLGIAVAGNLLGGVGLVFTTRLAQVRSEPDSSSGGHDEARQTGRGS
jgi:formate-nitrite transporter family protein